MVDIYGVDAFSPGEIAEKVENVGVAKARLPLMSLFVLGVLAGGFIGLGAMYYTVVASDPHLGFAAQRLLGGLAFSLGLVLVVLAGAELFTGNNLLVMAWLSGKITTPELVKNWTVVYASNFVGAAGLALLVYFSGHWHMADGAVGGAAVSIATAKTSLPFMKAFFLGVLCNMLVCLAVWLTMAGHSVVDKILAVVFPISAFVAAGFEHSVANMYFITLGYLIDTFAGAGGAVTFAGFAANLLPVTLGNIVGGSVMVGVVYHFIYRRVHGH